MTTPAPQRRIVLVTGLSGAGKSSILHTLEDLGYETVDNPPFSLLDELLSRTDRALAIGLDARTRGFEASAVLAAIERFKAETEITPEMVFATADDAVLLRRYTETRRRHPLAPQGQVRDGIAAERALIDALQAAADLVLDTSTLPLPVLRQRIGQRFGLSQDEGLSLTLISFAYRAGLPAEADLVFDARFLRNPHYDQTLRPRTGLDAEVCAYVAQDPDYAAFQDLIRSMVLLLLPRFVQEGKKYVTVAIGCSGGRHRSVFLIETLAKLLREAGWQAMVVHRELDRSDREKGMTGSVAA
ncbi:RNase adapter RapZ [Acidisoma cellulosilytica]|uniref:RNase adapter RapZ n=1 Tax=Acidisoma cellulosilyticum TaxID=2802395 RepID=A0A964E3X6_9PROT|nr:RNase adapter RapZ [Acidisoma cellulosilyticum]MCB8880861.1 RNase adapter RapZ [Acidisoma cellulosilyticum]